MTTNPALMAFGFFLLGSFTVMIILSKVFESNSFFRDIRLTDWLTAAFTLALAWFTWALVDVTTRTDEALHATANAQKALVDVSSKQTEITIQSERAFLVIDDLDFFNGEPNPNGVLFFRIKNTGKDVATIQKLNLSASFVSPLPDNAPLGKTIDWPLAVAPGVPVTMRAKLENPEGIFTAQVIDALKNGDKTLSVFGFIEYDNGYNNWLGLEPTQVGYCFTYVKPAERYGGETFDVCKNPKFVYVHEFRPEFQHRDVDATPNPEGTHWQLREPNR